MRILQIGADRSKSGVFAQGSSAYKRQQAYAAHFERLDNIGFTLQSDGFVRRDEGALHLYPTNSALKLFYALDALEIARGLKPDIVSAQDPFEAGFTAWIISVIKGVPLHVQVHTDFLSPYYARHSILNRLRTLLARIVISRAARVRVVSERVRESIQKRYRLNVPVTTLPIFVDLQRFKNASVPQELASRFAHHRIKFLVVSRLEPEKDVALAIHALVKAPHNSCLIIVGVGSLRKKLASLAKILGVEKRVFFEENADPAPYYKLADLVLVTSRYEGYGLVIVEALAAGKPVLSTDVGIAAEAGAIITAREKFADSLTQWCVHGSRAGGLRNYPYSSFDDYVNSYVNDLNAAQSSL